MFWEGKGLRKRCEMRWNFYGVLLVALTDRQTSCEILLGGAGADNTSGIKAKR